MRDSLQSRAAAAAESYASSLGVECRVMDREGRLLWPSGDPEKGCSLSLLHWAVPIVAFAEGEGLLRPLKGAIRAQVRQS